MPGRRTQFRGSGGGGVAGPTVIITDKAGYKDESTWVMSNPDTTGFKDSFVVPTAIPIMTDNIGGTDTLVITATPMTSDGVGAKDSLFVDTTPVHGDNDGFKDASIAFVQTQPDPIGYKDSLVLVGTGPVFTVEKWGGKDSLVVIAEEHAQARSGSPDSDRWGDSWVDRLLANQGVNHGADNGLTISANTALTQRDGYMEIDFTRYAGLVASGVNGDSFLSLGCIWGTAVSAPNVTLQVDFQTNGARLFTESTVTASNHARFSTPSPFTRRTFTFPLDSAFHTLIISLTLAEVNALLGQWLEVQFTVPDLSLDNLLAYSRERGGTNYYHLVLAR